MNELKIDKYPPQENNEEMLNDSVVDSVVNVPMVSEERSNTGGLTAGRKTKWKKKSKVYTQWSIEIGISFESEPVTFNLPQISV